MDLYFFFYYVIIFQQIKCISDVKKNKKNFYLDFRCMREKYNMFNLYTKLDLVYNL